MDKNKELQLLAFYMQKYAETHKLSPKEVLKYFYGKLQIKSRKELTLEQIIAFKESYKAGCTYATFFNT